MESILSFLYATPVPIDKLILMERIDNEQRTATLVKLAKAMGVSVDQLKDRWHFKNGYRPIRFETVFRVWQFFLIQLK